MGVGRSWKMEEERSEAERGDEWDMKDELFVSLRSGV